MSKPKFIIGIDEVGRGPIAGPVAVCALAVPNDNSGREVLRTLVLRNRRGELKDSKLMTEAEREQCFKKIQIARRRQLLNFSVSHVSEKFIDQAGIVPAISRALAKSLRKLCLDPAECQVFLDGGLRAPDEFKDQQTIIRGDSSLEVIALASVAAKVCRDRLMKKMAELFSAYGFERHKGYGTKDHYGLLEKIGPCEIHRQSFLKKFYDRLELKSAV